MIEGISKLLDRLGSFAYQAEGILNLFLSLFCIIHKVGHIVAKGALVFAADA